ncbi:MAG: hypothetical protein ICV66_10605 [Chitinophagaceae bacterium]|nr:hypothetical protein [Chitinophagaceae bacterium]
MKKLLVILLFSYQFTVFSLQFVQAQCSICTKTAQQLGEKPAKGLNAGIIYLALTPFAIGGIIAYRWWKRNGS